MATPPIPTVLPKSKPTAGVQRGRAAADFYSDLQNTMANLGPLGPAIDDPESFLGFGGPRTTVLPSMGYEGGRALVGDAMTGNLRISDDPEEIRADRQKQAGDFAKGMGLGLTTDIVGLAGDLPALLLSDAPRFAAALATGKSMDEMPKSLLDEGLNAIRNTIGSDALAGYLGVSEEELNSSAMTSGRILSSIVDPAVVYGVIRGAMGLSKARQATDATEQGVAGLLPAPARGDGEGIASLSANQRRQAAVEIMNNTGADMGRGQLEEFVARAYNARLEPDETLLTDFFGEEAGARMRELLTADGAQADIGADFDVVGERAEELLQARLEDPTIIETADDIIGNAAFEADPQFVNTQRVLFGARTEEELLQDYATRTSELNQIMTDIADVIDDPDAADELLMLQADRAQFEADLLGIRNELLGRRDGHLVQLTEAEAAGFGQPMPQNLADQIDQAFQTSDSARPITEDDIAPLDVSDSQGNIIPDEGFQAQPGGIGALDEAAPIYGNYTVKIGASPDQYLGTVEHYSPTMTNYYNFVGNRAFARQADNSGQMSAKQWLAALNKNPTSSQKIGPVAKELKDSEFERILLEDPEKKYTKDEIRRLLTSRLPQTRERVFLESNAQDEAVAGTHPFNGRLPYLDAQYRPEDLDSAVDKGLIIYSNTAPTIDVPGFGRQKPRAVHDYYGNYPGYYGHVRFIIVEGVDGKKYLQVNEIQSNSISNISSGFKVGSRRNAAGDIVPEYAKTLEQRLNAWRGGNEDVRIPFTPEVHAKLQKIQDLKPELVQKEERLRNEANRLDSELDQIDSEWEYTALDENSIKPESTVGTTIALGKTILAIPEDPLTLANLYADLEDYSSWQRGDATDRVDQLVTDALDAAGETYTARQIGNISDFLKDRYNTVQGFRDGTLRYVLSTESVKREVAGAPANRFFVQMEEYRPVLEAMTDEELFKIFLKDKVLLTHETGQLYKTTAEITSNKNFMDAIDNLSPDELEALKSSEMALMDRQKAAIEKVVNSLTEEDLNGIRDAVTLYRENELTNMMNEAPRDYVTGENVDFSKVVADTVENVLTNDFDLNGLLLKSRRTKLRENLSGIEDELTNMDSDGTLNNLKDEYQDTLLAQPDAEDLKTLAAIAKKSEDTDGRKGFQAPEPYNSDAEFYQFATRSIIKQAEKLGLDGVIFPDAHYLATQPQREPNDAFLRNYGRVLDGELSELSKADQNAGVRIRRTDTPVTDNENPGIRISGRTNNNFVVKGVDPNDEAAQEALQPLRDEVRTRRQAVVDAQEAGDDTAGLSSQYRQAKAVLDNEIRRRSREYATPLRVVEFDNPANRELAQRPIRRATGGMVRSGIGAMAREVM